MKAFIFVSAILLVFPFYSFAGEIQVKNARIDEINNQKKYAFISFDVSWENSWRSDITGMGYAEPYNYDAAWVFVKFRDKAGRFRHASLSAISKSHRSDGKAAISASRDGRGVFVYSAQNFSGPADYKGIKLKWNFGSDNIDINQDTEIRVLAVEMVFIPGGSFYAGDGGSYGSFFNTRQGVPALISQEPVLLKASSNSFDDGAISNEGVWVSGASGIRSKDGDFENPEFPTGYGAFYVMKYEISQGEYAGFLNLISAGQSYGRDLNAEGQYRNTITFNGRQFVAKRPKRACNFLSWMDGAAYADWTGLRPMTELEFEKACRGYNSNTNDANMPVKNEYAWNDDSIAAAGVIAGTEDGSESVNGNAAFDNVTYKGGDGLYGPLGCGVFEKPGPRNLSGKSYYGVCELSGNLSEQCVTLGNTAGRSFMGNDGDGVLTETGEADESSWPGINGNADEDKANLKYIGNIVESPGITAAAGSGQRGGNWYTRKTFLMISDRAFASHPLGRRSEYAGFRCVRYAQ